MPRTEETDCPCEVFLSAYHSVSLRTPGADPWPSHSKAFHRCTASRPFDPFPKGASSKQNRYWHYQPTPLPKRDDDWQRPHRQERPARVHGYSSHSRSCLASKRHRKSRSRALPLCRMWRRPGERGGLRSLDQNELDSKLDASSTDQRFARADLDNPTRPWRARMADLAQMSYWKHFWNRRRASSKT